MVGIPVFGIILIVLVCIGLLVAAVVYIVRSYRHDKRALAEQGRISQTSFQRSEYNSGIRRSTTPEFGGQQRGSPKDCIMTTTARAMVLPAENNDVFATFDDATRENQWMVTPVPIEPTRLNEANLITPSAAPVPVVRSSSKRHGTPGIPKSWKKLTNEIQKSPTIQLHFGTEELQAFKTVYLGSTPVSHSDVSQIECNHDSSMKPLRQVVLNGDNPRAAILVLSATKIGVVDRTYFSEVFTMYPTSSIKYHGIQQLENGPKGPISFITFVGYNQMFDRHEFYALECKPTWSEFKVQHVWNAFHAVVETPIQRPMSTVSHDAIDSPSNREYTGGQLGIAASTQSFVIPKFAKIHHVKYGGTLPVTTLDEVNLALKKLLTETPKQLKKAKSMTQSHPSGLSLAHLPKAVLVIAPDGIRLLDPHYFEIMSTIVPLWIESVKSCDLQQLSQPVSVQTATHDVEQALSTLAPGQRELLRRGLESGDMTNAEVLSAARQSTSVQGSAITIVSRNLVSGLLQCDVVVTDATINPKEVMDRIGKISEKAMARDPFQPTAEREGAVDEILKPHEIDRNDVLAVKMVGTGFFGEVFLALKSTEKNGRYDETQCAVKTLRPGANFEQQRGFLDEVAMQLSLDHKNLVKVIGICTVEEPVLALLEFVQYGDLQQVLMACETKGIMLTYTEQLHIMKQAAAGLEFMHSERFVHMDVAARNILLGENSVAKIADFGISRKYDDGRDGYKLAKRMVIPQLYQPPETFPPVVKTGKNSRASGVNIPIYNEKTDVWGYGVFVWEVLMYGAKPYAPFGNLIQKLREIRDGARLELPSDTPKSFHTFVMTMFSSQPSSRPTFTQVVEFCKSEFIQHGSPHIRDVGLLQNDGLTKKLNRISQSVSSLRIKMVDAARTATSPEPVSLKRISEDAEDLEEANSHGLSPGRTKVEGFSSKNWEVSRGMVRRKSEILLSSSHKGAKKESFMGFTTNDEVASPVKRVAPLQFGFNMVDPYDSDDSDDGHGEVYVRSKRESVQWQSAVKTRSSSKLEMMDDAEALREFLSTRTELILESEEQPEAHSRKENRTVKGSTYDF